jgi:DUF1680 family protein
MHNRFMGMHSKSLTRRNFVGIGAAAAAGSCVKGFSPSQPESHRNSSPLEQFGYSQVTLAPGPLQRQFEDNHRLFRNLNEDGLLKPFRQRVGLPAPGPDMGGWYDTSPDFSPPGGSFHGFIPGHSFGQYMSALSRFYAATGDSATRQKVSRLVKGYAQTITSSGRFYVDYHLPAYTYDKTVCGLIDAHEFADDPLALAVLKRATDEVLPHLPEKALTRPEQEARPHKDIAYTWDETYTLPENQFLAWRRSGDQRYRQLAIRFLLNKEYFDPLSRGENVLPGKHAYSHVNALSSAAQTYLVLEDEKYLQAARNGFRMVQEQSYATGGWGPNETFQEPGKSGLGDSLKTTRSSFETPCGAYGHFKITRYLLRITRDSRYGDSMEQILYNTVLGAKPIQPDGTSFYYSDYHTPAQKVYYKDKWPCCSGTLPQLAADYRISVYFRDSQGLCVNLYVPSTLKWQEAGGTYSIQQTTSYPYEGRIQLDLMASQPKTFSVFLRIPEWANDARVSVNGVRGNSKVSSGTFAELRREWKSGDRIELELPLPLRLQAVDAQHPAQLALVRGPLVLMALTNSSPSLSRSALLAAKQQAPSSRIWTAESHSGTVRFTPFIEIRDEQYITYVTAT